MKNGRLPRLAVVDRDPEDDLCCECNNRQLEMINQFLKLLTIRVLSTTANVVDAFLKAFIVCWLILQRQLISLNARLQ